MIAILSPAKTLDFESKTPYSIATNPAFVAESEYLAKQLAKLSKAKLSELMKLSDNLTNLNYQRYKEWNFEDTSANKKQAIYAFNGDVYNGFKVEELNQADIEYAQNHIRILSGIYGILKPMDMMQPYRLEMGTKVKFSKAKTLYQYWDKKVTEQLNDDFHYITPKLLINLASNEYFKVIQPNLLDAEIIDITFKDLKNGQLKVIAFYAKEARGAMARFIVQQRAKSLDDLKQFNEDGYAYDDNLSTEKELVFTR